MTLWISPRAGLLALCAFGLAACGSEKSAPAADAPVETAETPVETVPGESASTELAEPDPAAMAAAAELAAANLAKAEAFLSENAKNKAVKKTASGLQYEVVTEGPADGFQPKASDLVDVHYVGTLIDGVEFDSSRARGEPARFPLNQVIPGWTEGVQLMSEGDKFRFFIPPALAYGAEGTPGGPIGPNEALIFEVELLKVTSPERNLATATKFLEENAGKDGVVTTASGLQYQIVTEGKADGKQPTESNVVKVNYLGTLIGGEKFDSSYDRGQPIEFPLGQVIPGWVEGVQLMSEGDKFRFFIPPALAYGERGTPGGPIGPNEALIFEVELLEVK